MKQICKMYQIENLKKQGVIGKELEKHLKEQFLHLLKSINTSIAIYALIWKHMEILCYLKIMTIFLT